MGAILKGIGVLALVVCISGFGFFKADGIKDEIKRLKSVISALTKADNMVRCGGYNKEKILKTAFYGVNGFALKGGAAYVSDKAVSKEAEAIINAFFADFGGGDIPAERRRIAATKDELLKLLCEREKTCAAESKIWRTTGVCAGLALGIMLI